MGEALFLYVLSVKRSGVLTDLRGLFSASWIGGEGLACLQWSKDLHMEMVQMDRENNNCRMQKKRTGSGIRGKAAAFWSASER